MIYRDFQNLKLSALGMGCMRLPLCEGNNSDIDIDATKKMVSYAFEKGINYFDTAWGYHDGNSETVLGGILKEYPRDSFYLASKFPGYDLNNIDKVEEIFEEQLKKCQVDYFRLFIRAKEKRAYKASRLLNTWYLRHYEAFFRCLWRAYGILSDSA